MCNDGCGVGRVVGAGGGGNGNVGGGIGGGGVGNGGNGNENGGVGGNGGNDNDNGVFIYDDKIGWVGGGGGGVCRVELPALGNDNGDSETLDTVGSVVDAAVKYRLIRGKITVLK